MFPEGTRTTQTPINALQASVAIIAKQAGVPIQTLIIEIDSPFLSKGWSLFRRTSLPVNYRMRLGPRLDAPGDVRACMTQLDQTLRAALAHPAQNLRIETRGEGEMHGERATGAEVEACGEGAARRERAPSAEVARRS